MALRLRGATSGYIELKAPASAGDNTLTLPTNNGSANQILKTDGSGNLSWVDDANTQLTFANDSNNRVITGTGSGLNAEASLTFDGHQLYVTTGNASDPLLVNSTYANRKSIIRETSDANSNAGLTIQKKHSTLHPNGYWYGDIRFEGWDGDQYRRAALIECVAEGTPANDNMPGQLRIHTNPGQASQVERIRITKDGKIGIGTTSPGCLLEVNTADNSDNHAIANFSGTDVGNAASFFMRYYTCGSDDNRTGFYFQHENVANVRMWMGDDAKLRSKASNPTSGNDGNAFVQENVGANNIKMNNGQGIDFSATSDTGGMTNELLDDYEEGTFTPTIGFASNSANDWTYNAQQGTYLKVGNLCHFVLRIDIGNAGSGNNGWVEITGLPFGMYDMMSGISYEGTTTCDVHDAASNQTGLRALFYQSANKLLLINTGGDTSFFASDRQVKKNDLVQNSTDIRIRGVYRTT